jgi:pSer/pThr/pTyr-binding forkhead associated (FHA) protein
MEILLSISSKTDNNVREVKRTLDDGLVVGRGAEEGILLEGLDLSREHFVLTLDGSEVRVTDLSVNGTWLSGTRLQKSVAHPVRPGDVIEIPGYLLSYRLTEQPAETGEVKVSELPPAIPEDHQVAAIVIPSNPPGLLDPVFRVVRSFTLMEKVLTLIALSGLILLATYIGA